MKKPEFLQGAEARKNFEEGMMKLFRVPKSVVAKKPAPKKAPPAPKGRTRSDALAASKSS